LSIADLLGNGGDAAWARDLHRRASEDFESFWDSSRGTYIDHIVDDEPQLPASQLAGALAIVSGLAPSVRWCRIVEWIGDPQRQAVRSWIGGHGGYDIAKILDQVRGIQTIDWDAASQTVVAQPFAAFLVHDAYVKAGRPDLLLTSLRRWSSFLRDGYDTFGECWGWGTPAHGWSATPTRDLVQAVLGVTPATPGFSTARIAPAYGAATRFAGSVPTPAGPLTVEVGTEHVTVATPVPAIVTLPDGSERRIPAGTSTCPAGGPSS